MQLRAARDPDLTTALAARDAHAGAWRVQRSSIDMDNVTFHVSRQRGQKAAWPGTGTREVVHAIESDTKTQRDGRSLLS
ncbi:hypothetical protein ACV22V_15575 [Burkholderia sp. AW33-5]